MTLQKLTRAVRHNCNISDARDSGIYSICTLVLKLRNLYKWEHGLQPWQEADSADLLSWIEDRENDWDRIRNESFLPLPLKDAAADPFAVETVNEFLAGGELIYGAGYGRSLKAVFFLGRPLAELTAAGKRVIIVGEEVARELASPFALTQEGIICIRRDPLRYFFWDHLQEAGAASRCQLVEALRRYGLSLETGSKERLALVDRFDEIIDREMDLFIYHEVGELQNNPLDGETLRRLVAVFPHTPFELLARAVKDLLADTHPRGVLGYILAEKRESSLGFYAAFLDGIRKRLFPEIGEACRRFWQAGDWSVIEEARLSCRRDNEERAVRITELSRRLDSETPERLLAEAGETLLRPLGL